MPFILVTGGTGYIGSHTVVALISAGYDPVIVDNLSNSKITVLERIEAITGKRPPFYQIDLRDSATLEKVFQKHSIDSVIHFAGLKSVGESIAAPLHYYENNIQSTLSLCFVMAARGVKKLIFSSSAAIYGNTSISPISEDCPPAPTNPYARTKLIIEQILQDIHVADSAWRIILLRYFNPVGAHQSGLIGEDPQGIPNNLMPSISQVAVGRRERIKIFGSDYPTLDGTGMRDYIHVMDLAEGHIAALRYMEKAASSAQQSQESNINLSSPDNLSFPHFPDRKLRGQASGGDTVPCHSRNLLAGIQEKQKHGCPTEALGHDKRESFPLPPLSFPRRRESMPDSSSPNSLSSLDSLSVPRRRESRGLTAPPLIVNLGTGRGYSVLELLHAFEDVSGKKIPYQITDRRHGDIATCFADPTLAKELLDWTARRTLEDMCSDTWRWQSDNPSGYP